MDIVLVLLATGALAGAAIGFRLKAFALVPMAILIAVFSAAVLHTTGFGPGSGIATIVACLVLNQAAYILVQILGPDLASDRPLDISAIANHAPATTILYADDKCAISRSDDMGNAFEIGALGKTS